jgi:ABC-type transporter Mla maintaining outer membrane lipid asymmetry ATPase subunit MlaF
VHNRVDDHLDRLVLDIVGLVKDYHALRPLRFERFTIRDGEQMAVVGLDAPAAEMLTTLVTGAALPDTGSIRVFGQSTADIANQDQWLAVVDRLGLVTDRAALLDDLTVAQNIALPLTLDIDAIDGRIRERVETLATEAGLARAVWDRPVGSLDGEARLRARLARAVALDPGLLVLEHPTAQVARSAVSRLARDLRSIGERRAIAMLVITSDEDLLRAATWRVMDWEAARGTLRERRRSWLSWGRRR